MANKTYRFSLWDAFLLDYIRHSGIYVFLIPVTIIVPVVIWQGPFLEAAAWFLAGWAVFLPQEYLTHLYVLHFPPPENGWFYRQMYRLHYGHHDLPSRSDLMYMPLWLVLPMLMLNLLIFQFLTPNTHALLSMVGGLIAGYLFYEWTHLFCHLPYQPKTRLGQFVKRRHALHHFRNENVLYSVSAPAIFLDYLAGTAQVGDAAVGGADRYLGVDENDPRLLESRRLLAAQSTGDLHHSKVWLRHLRARGIHS
jgi:hypothetical protein